MWNSKSQNSNAELSKDFSKKPFLLESLFINIKLHLFKIYFNIFKVNEISRQQYGHTSICNQWRIQDFPEEGAQTPQGAPTYDFAKFSQKLHEIERIWTGGGGSRPLHPLDPPLAIFRI